MNVFATYMAVIVMAMPAISQNLPNGFELEDILPGDSFFVPTAIAFSPTGKLFVAEKRGRVYVVENGVKLEPPFISIEDEALDTGDLGLLGLAVDPDFSHNKFVYLLYVVDPNEDGVDDEELGFGRLTRYKAQGGNPNQADLSSRQVLLGEQWRDAIPVCHLSHSVGAIRFGTDGTMFISTGDGASFNGTDTGGITPDCFGDNRIDPNEDIGRFRSQTITSLSGKILRLDPATGLGLPSNPYFTGDASDTESKIWAYGLRNPFRFEVKHDGSSVASDGQPGSLFIGDVGLGKFEELDLSDAGGQNYGWPCFQGPVSTSLRSNSKCKNIGSDENPVGSAPLFVYTHHDDPDKSRPSGFTGEAIIGGAFYTGNRYPGNYRGYFFGDFVEGWIRVLRVNDNNEVIDLDNFASLAGRSLVDFQADPVTGDIHYVDIAQGQVFRIRFSDFQDEMNLGDVNADNKCNSTDVLIILSQDVGLQIPQELSDRIISGLGDVNSDTFTNSTDALIILSVDVGLPAPFPVCEPAGAQ